MPTRARGAVAAAGIAIVAGGVAVVGPPWEAHQYRSVSTPPATASEWTVVSAYLDALDAHDCATALALSTARHHARAETWCGHVASLERTKEMEEATVTPAGQAATLASIYVRISVRQHWWRHDPSVVDGRHRRSYDVVQTSAGWRIDGEGRG